MWIETQAIDPNKLKQILWMPFVSGSQVLLSLWDHLGASKITNTCDQFQENVIYLSGVWHRLWNFDR